MTDVFPNLRNDRIRNCCLIVIKKGRLVMKLHLGNQGQLNKLVLPHIFAKIALHYNEPKNDIVRNKMKL